MNATVCERLSHGFGWPGSQTEQKIKGEALCDLNSQIGYFFIHCEPANISTMLSVVELIYRDGYKKWNSDWLVDWSPTNIELLLDFFMSTDFMATQLEHSVATSLKGCDCPISKSISLLQTKFDLG